MLRATMQNYESLCFAAEEDLGIITLNRPNRRNALSLELMLELIDCLEQIGKDRDLRAVILAAAGKVRRLFSHLAHLVHRFHQLLRSGGDFLRGRADFRRGRRNFVGGALLLARRRGYHRRRRVHLDSRFLHLSD